jgi:hypothetical protein
VDNRGYVIAGVVVHSVSREPIKGAHVMLTDTSQRSRLIALATSGADGRFRFEPLKAGKYSLSAERLGFARQAYNQRLLGQRYASAVVTGAGEKTDALVFALVPYAVIDGTVIDNEGDAVTKALVEAFRVIGHGETRRAIRAASAITDDLGHYRMATLAAGSYALSASGRPWHLSQLSNSGAPSSTQLAYPITFYPASEDPGAAELLSLKAGGEVRADVVVRLGPVARVTVNFDGTLRAARQSERMLVLTCEGPFGIELAHYRLPIGADLEETIINDVAPGRYRINLVGTYSILARQVVDIAGDNLEVNLGAVPLAQISGRLEVRGDRNRLGSQPVATIQPIAGTTPMAFPVASDGTFSFGGMEAGRYRVGLHAMGSFALASVAAQGHPALSGVFEVPQTGAVDLRLVVDTTVADVTGKVFRAESPVSGAAVVLIPRAHPDDWSGYRVDQSDSDGSFLWPGVPAGEYLALALDEDLDFDLLDPTDLRPFLDKAVPVTISGQPGQVVRLELNRQ